MKLTELLKSKIINTGAIATAIYPDKPAQNARALLRNKIYEINGNKINTDDEKKIKKILKNICIVL